MKVSYQNELYELRKWIDSFAPTAPMNDKLKKTLMQMLVEVET